MPLDAFPGVNPTDVDVTVEPRVLTANLGDGYQQRAADGLNTMPKTASLAWENLTIAEANTIENFFLGKGGHTAFTFTIPKESTSLKWICTQWTRSPKAGGYVNMKATFKQVFDL